MITEITVNGFRSLNDFELNFNNGLNLLVGPNGAGKTNIISFLDFIADFTKHDVAYAISSAGGANFVFPQENRTAPYSDLSFSITGVCQMTEFYYTDESKIKYKYEATVRLDRENGLLILQYQKVSTYLSNLMRWDTLIDLENPDWQAITEKRYFDESDKYKYRIPVFKRRISDKFGAYMPIKKGKTFSSSVSLSVTSRPEDSLVKSLSRYNPIYTSIQEDLTKGRSLNIIPEVAKNPNDFARQSGISSSGEGLAATLYHLQEGTTLKKRVSRHSREKLQSRASFERVNKYFQLVNPQINGLRIEKNIEQGLYIGYIKIDNNMGSIELPLSSVSDGTAKWLALSTALISSNSVFSIEEPENFLHPYMQIELINLIRETVSRSELPQAIIVSTHSETILNRCKADEIIICGINGSKTQAFRHPDHLEIQKSIEKSGFGLGYFYIAGAFDD